MTCGEPMRWGSTPGRSLPRRRLSVRPPLARDGGEDDSN